MTEEIIIDGVNAAGCCHLFKFKGFDEYNEEYTEWSCDIGGSSCENIDNCYYKQLKRLEQENKELSELIRNTKDYAEVCSVCKDEVTIYPNISGRTDYTQNEVECRTLAQIIARKNNLEQENKELKAYKDVNEDFKKAWDELNKKYTEVLKLAKENADSNEYCLQELEKKNFALTQESQQKSQTICELKQENEQLKKELESQKGLITVGGKQQYEMTMAYDRCKSALEEIKKVLKKICKEECDYTKPKFCGDCDCRYGQILDKINEVLE